MSFNPMDLLPVLEREMRRYTGGYSSSITYETARQLQSAVTYCLEDADPQALSVQPPDLLAAFRSGLERKKAKVVAAQQFYEQMVVDFIEYDNKAYCDTIIKGMPEFFLRYDVEFNGRDHLLSLDYPLLQPLDGLEGIELITAYLHCIEYEGRFLGCFEQTAVLQTMSEFSPHPQTDIFNICRVVLLRALSCLLVGRSGPTLAPKSVDIMALQSLLEDFNSSELEVVLTRTFSRLAGEVNLPGDVQAYLLYSMPSLAGEFASYLKIGQAQTLLSLIT